MAGENCDEAEEQYDKVLQYFNRGIMLTQKTTYIMVSIKGSSSKRNGQRLRCS